MRAFARRWQRGLVVICILWAACCAAPALRAQETIVEDCTEAALREALLGGGDVIFTEDCEITLEFPLDIPPNVTSISADGNAVTISGNNTNLIFNILPRDGTEFELIGITVIEGRGVNGGAMFIPEDAVVTLTECVFSDNAAVGVDGTDGEDGDNGGNAGDSGTAGTSGESAFGGAIYNLGELSIFSCQFISNSVAGGNGGNGGDGGTGGITGGNGGIGGDGGRALGGAIYSLGTLTVQDTTFAGNTATGGDGGVGGLGGAAPTPGLNRNGGRGGAASGAGIYSFQDLGENIVEACTFSDNTATGGDSADAGTQGNAGNVGFTGGEGSGGGIFNRGELSVENSTFFRNIVNGGDGGNGGSGYITGGRGGHGGNAAGGSLYSTGLVSTVNLVNCTFSSGGAFGGTNGVGGSGPTPGNNGTPGRTQGGNVASTNGAGQAVMFIVNSIFVTNGIHRSGFGKFVDLGHNISRDTSMGLQVGVNGSMIGNPQLKALADNGGSTKTMAIPTNSIARDAGDDASAPAVDQRGAARSGVSDIGAYEVSAPTILVHPKSSTNAVGTSVTFTVSAIGEPPLTYRWQFNGSNIFAALGSNYTITSVQLSNQGSYRVLVTSVGVTAISSNATLTIGAGPTIVTPPTSQIVVTGGTANFSVTAAGDSPLFYQWRMNGTNLTARTNDTLPIVNVQSTNVGIYSVVISNVFGTITSSNVTLTIGAAPSITTEPVSQTVFVNHAATFTVVGSGSPSPGYQWRFYGTNVPGATAASFSRSSAQFEHAGPYDVLVTNVLGTVDSVDVFLTVTNPSAQSIASPGIVLATNLSVVSTNLSFSYQTETGALYVVQYKNTLLDSNWVSLVTNTGNGSVMTNLFPATNRPARFFRLLIR